MDEYSHMSEEKWYEKDFFTDDRKEKGKKAGKASATTSLGWILISFFLGYIFLNSGLYGVDMDATQLEMGVAFAVFVFLSFIYAFFGLFTGVYYIFHLQDWFFKAQALAGLTGKHWLMWIGFYPVAFIGCLINFILIVVLVFLFVRWIIRKIRRQ